MLHRDDPDGLIVISQRTHEWLAGQLGRAWGNDEFGHVAPWEEVCLAAEQHGIGWLVWEQEPTLNPATGRPHLFFELPMAAQIELMGRNSRWMLTQGRYPALLVSLHYSFLYGQHDSTQQPTEVATAARRWLAGERALQEELLASLRGDPYYARFSAPEAVEHNRRLVLTWDRMSLALCAGLSEARTFPDIRTVEGQAELTLAPLSTRDEVAVDPWPFRSDEVTLVYEGRRLPETFPSEGAMRRALRRAPWVTITTRLRRAAA